MKCVVSFSHWVIVGKGLICITFIHVLLVSPSHAFTVCCQRSQLFGKIPTQVSIALKHFQVEDSTIVGERREGTPELPTPSFDFAVLSANLQTVSLCAEKLRDALGTLGPAPGCSENLVDSIEGVSTKFGLPKAGNQVQYFGREWVGAKGNRSFSWGVGLG